MGDWPRLVNLRRCARGNVLDTGEATNTTCALTNGSTGAELILVWEFAVDSNSGGQLQWSYQQQQPLTNLGTVAAVVPGDAPPPGIMSAGDQPTLYPPDFVQTTSSWPWQATFPFAVLLPGWSLFAQGPPGDPATGALGVSYFWEAILPKYFDRMHTHYYLELALAQQGG